MEGKTIKFEIQNYIVRKYLKIYESRQRLVRFSDPG